MGPFGWHLLSNNTGSSKAAAAVTSATNGGGGGGGGDGATDALAAANHPACHQAAQAQLAQGEQELDALSARIIAATQH